MTYTKYAEAKRLFDSIGTIDDSLIAEAQNAPVFKQKGFSLKHLVPVAVAACVAIFIGAGALGAVLLPFVFNGADKVEQPPTLESVLNSASQGGAATYCKKEDINLFSGKAGVVWESDNGDGYYLLELSSERELSELKGRLHSGAQEIDAETARGIESRIWVCFGDGTVVSPHLKASAGNVGYGELFDYSPEVIPSNGFVAFINGLTV